jgi:hypothetical protein
VCSTIDVVSLITNQFLIGGPFSTTWIRLSALGIGTSDWIIPSAQECREKATRAGEFIRWHMDEWVALAERLQRKG